MGARGMSERLQKSDQNRAYPQSLKRSFPQTRGDSQQVLLKQFIEIQNTMETLIRSMQRDGSCSIACALMSRLAEMRTRIETATASPQGDSSLHKTLMHCVAESKQMINLLECTWDL